MKENKDKSYVRLEKKKKKKNRARKKPRNHLISERYFKLAKARFSMKLQIAV